MFSLIQLESFVAVAEELHFGAAAERLNMTQPPLSRQIQLLERELQAKLFIRTSRNVALTAAGEVLLPNARRILDMSRKTSLEVSRVSTGESGTVVVGYTSVAGQSVLPEFLARAAQKLPELTMVLREAVSVDQLDALSKGTIDIGLLRPVVHRSGITTCLIRKDRLVVALPEGHHLVTGKGVLIKELVGLPLMMYSTSEARYFYDLVLRLFDSVSAKPTISQVASQIPALMALVGVGLGVSLVPASAMNFAPNNVVFEELIGPDGLADLNHSDIFLAWDESSSNPAVKRLKDVFLDSLVSVEGAVISHNEDQRPSQ
ncbi:LysR family transcriptional regulator [Arthrobacter sp. MYb213]|uniref:LysR family transcriptional regulator n=1 Tax=Arthrobacter sp. MYb213 TaxID=1848595 RepID=UPI000CFBF7EE|nr:LysR family transcriptional regulator [Arthrobacter sp. MYb213]PRB68102.1 LysR family transcriptional regulator [Arthrobacter sp. MYb213]